MKRLPLIVFMAAICFAQSSYASGLDIKSPNAGFEISGYLNTAVGFQHFSNAPITDVADDASFGGSLGEWLPNVASGTIPSPGEDFAEVAVPGLELDIVKHFGNRARVRSDIFFGRAGSGSQYFGVSISHAYAAVTLSNKYGLELVVGRFGLPPGFEPYELYFSDSVSWSIIWRSLICPGAGTGAMLSWAATDNIDILLAATNGIVHDWTSKGNNLPVFISSMLVTWGDEAKPSTFALSPYGGPESGNNRPETFGTDATLSWWINRKWQLGLEVSYQRDNAVAGIPAARDTSYYAGLLNVHWEPNPAWYVFGRYTTSWQTAPGNGVMNLTGAEQIIHEMTLGMGHFIAEGVKLKLEGRFDIVSPANAPKQWIGSGGLGLAVAY